MDKNEKPPRALPCNAEQFLARGRFMSFTSQQAHLPHALLFFFAILSAQNSSAAATRIGRRINRLETGVRAEEATPAVERLQHTHAHYPDFGLWPDFSDLFTENAVGQFPAGTVTGRTHVLGKL